MRDMAKEEWERLHRVAVGRICGCKDCICCRELAAHTLKERIKSQPNSNTNVLT